jgi:hypothetical protein
VAFGGNMPGSLTTYTFRNVAAQSKLALAIRNE